MPVPSVKVCQDFSQGDSFDIKVSHNPGFDITGAVFELNLSAKEGGDPALTVSHTVPAGADATAGIATIPVSATDTANIAPGLYFGSLKRTLAGGEVRTILRSNTRTSSGAVVKKVEVYENLDTTP